jgi:hypothetical protein
LILRRLDDSLLNASNTKKLGSVDIKYVARNVLTALAGLHERGYVHTGNCLIQIRMPYSVLIK